MSIIVALKDGDVVVLATDSRFMNPDFTTIHSDNTPKIYEIGSDGFIATGGFTMACEFQQTRAPELARELGTADIEVIGEALARESLPVMRELVSLLSSTVLSDPGRYENLRQKVSGESLLHACTLVGRNAQKDAGYLTYSFGVANGEVVYERVAYFGRARMVNVSAALPPLELNLWAQRLQRQGVMECPPISAVRLILREAKSALIGGPDQIAVVDAKGGAKWLDRPPAQNEAVPEIKCADSSIGSRTITAAISMTSPTITGGAISGASFNGGSISTVAVTTEALSIWSIGGTASMGVDSSGRLMLTGTLNGNLQASNGATGSFTSGAHTLTITTGIITGIT
jgi:hypothetical protein